MADRSASAKCPTCGFENGPKSTYCQDCGARLERPTTGSAPPPDRVPPRVSKNDPPPTPTPIATAAHRPASEAKIKSAHVTRRSFGIGGLLIGVVRAVFFGALAAVIIQAFRQPADIPPPSAPFTPEVIENVRKGFRNKISTRGSFTAPWQSVNSYLQTVLKDAPTSTSFVRIAMQPRGNGFSLFTVRKLIGIPIYTAVDYELVDRGGGVGLKRTGAEIGRIRMPEWAAALAESLQSGLDTMYFSEIEGLSGAKQVEIRPDAAIISFASP